MALSPVTKVFAVEDCQIAAMLTDPAAGTATYDDWIDVPGIKTVEISGAIDVKELRGDNQLLDSQATLTSISVAISHAKLSAEVLQILLGGTTTPSGSGTTEKNTFVLAGDDRLSYFKLEAKTPTGGADTPTGDVHFALNKLILASFPDMGLTEEDYRISSFQARAVPRISDNEWITIVENETAAAITGS